MASPPTGRSPLHHDRVNTNGPKRELIPLPTMRKAPARRSEPRTENVYIGRMSQFGLDPIKFLNDFNVYVAQMEDQARELAEIQQATAKEVSNKHVKIRVQAGRVLGLEFTDAAAGASPVQVRTSLMDAYHRAAARSNDQLANSLSTIGLDGVASGVRESASPDVREAGQGLDPEEPHQRPTGHTEPEKLPWASVEELWADAGLDDEDLTDIAAELRELGYDDSRRSATGDWQTDLEQALAQVEQHSADLRHRIAEITGRAEGKTMTVTVNGAGSLTDVVLRKPSAQRSAQELSTDFLKLYGEACTAASEQLSEAMPDSDWPDIPGVSRFDM